MKFALSVLALAATVHADVYMHNPRGSNDRNCEKNVNRNNGNRLFDSQNNAKGGYACGRAVGGNNVITKPMSFHAGSLLPVEWTQQHGCGQDPNNPGKENVDCQIVIQYACEDTLDPGNRYASGNRDLAGTGTAKAYVGAPRDGIPQNANDDATDRIPQNVNAADLGATNNFNNAFAYGMHENLLFYETCNRRERNRGLFTADQNVNRRDATGTRQNPNGGRRGLECPEERDYYPYWHPTPWKDAAVLTSDPAQCATIQANAQERKGYGHCKIPTTAAQTQTQAPNGGNARNLYNNREWPNNPADCQAAGQQWVEELYFQGSGIKPDPNFKVDCQAAAYARSNHLGNAATNSAQSKAFAVNGVDPEAQNDAQLTANTYQWQIPDVGATPKQCVLRLRYNMSSSEVNQDPPLSAAQNGQVITQDPYVEVGAKASEFLALNVNTNQYGRTFQDRSYVFEIKPKAPGYGGPNEPKLFNLNVRGKRGNIVQTYPSVEYDFIPNDLQLGEGDGVHFQWTGSDYNPRRGCNDGTGGPPDGNANQNARADRANLVEFSDSRKNFPAGNIQAGAYKTGLGSGTGKEINEAKNLAFLGQDVNNCLTQNQLNNINNENARENNVKNCAFLNRAGISPESQGKGTPYFDGGVIKFSGENRDVKFMSSRNNNFSNRDTKVVLRFRKDATAPVAPSALEETKPEPSKAFVSGSKNLGADDAEPPQRIENDGSYNADAQAKCE
mmetsp:Transcript_35842/g.70418  ORF Transcript_35842/g.70418 Transcript_35842/m.70418 type:complete len:729 (+) Transcript_35842:95-2281(+)